MGKSRNAAPPAADGGAMTFMMFTLKGDRATMQEGFRTMAETIERVAPGSRVHSAHVPTAPALAGPAAALAEELTEEGEHGNGEVLDGDAFPVAPAAPSSNGKTTKRPPPRSPSLIPDLKFDDVSPTLKEVFDAHPHKKNTMRYLVIAYWLKKYKNIDEVSMDHMHSGYRACGWNVPNDADAPLRGMLKQDWFTKSKPGFYKIHHIGEKKAMEHLGEAS